jgi:hypothetical protein
MNKEKLTFVENKGWQLEDTDDMFYKTEDK